MTTWVLLALVWPKSHPSVPSRDALQVAWSLFLWEQLKVLCPLLWVLWHPSQSYSAQMDIWKPLSPPQLYHPQHYWHSAGARDESTFSAVLLYGDPQTVYFGRNLGFKTPRRLGLSWKMYPLQWVPDSVIRAKGWKKKCQFKDETWLHGDTWALSVLILVVIGIKLAHVDMALKGKKTTSHFLFNLSFKPAFFQTSGGVFTAVCFAVAWRPSLAWQPAVPRAVCMFRRETHREEVKIYAGRKGNTLFWEVRGWLGVAVG